MKSFTIIISFSLLVFFALQVTGQTINGLFPRYENGVENQLRIEHDNDGNTIIAGQFHIPSGTGGTPSPTNIWLEKYNTNNQLQWSIETDLSFSSTDSELIEIAVDDDGYIYICGVYVGSTFTFGKITLEGYNNQKIDYFVGKVSPEGEVLWLIGPEADSYPEYHRIVTTISVANDGGILVGANFYRDHSFAGLPVSVELSGTSSFSPPGSFIAKLDSDGQGIWAQSLKNLLSGESNGGIGPADILQAPSSGDLFMHMRLDSAVVMGTDTIVSAGVPANEDLHAIVKADSEGNFIDYIITQSLYNQLDNFELDHCGEILLLGSYMESIQIGDQQIEATSSRDVFVAKLDSNLNTLWLKQHGSSGGDQASGLYFNDQNEVFFTFEFWGDINYEEPYTGDGLDMALVKLGSDGEYIWQTHTTGSGYIQVHNISVSPQNEIETIGVIRGEENFGSNSVETPMNGDFFLPEVIRANWLDEDYSGEPVNCDETTAIKKIADADRPFKIYPNPANEQLTIEFKNDPQPEITVYIMDLRGKIIKSQVVNNAQAIMDVQNLSDGLYLIKSSNKPENVMKFIKQ